MERGGENVGIQNRKTVMPKAPSGPSRARRRSPRKGKHLKFASFKGMCGRMSGGGYVLVSRGAYVSGRKAKSRARRLGRERVAHGSYLRAK